MIRTRLVYVSKIYASFIVLVHIYLVLMLAIQWYSDIGRYDQAHFLHVTDYSLVGENCLYENGMCYRGRLFGLRTIGDQLDCVIVNTVKPQVDKRDMFTTLEHLFPVNKTIPYYQRSSIVGIVDRSAASNSIRCGILQRHSILSSQWSPFTFTLIMSLSFTLLGFAVSCIYFLWQLHYCSDLQFLTPSPFFVSRP